LDALDVGCGGGLLSESLARMGAHVKGIDATERCIQMARKHKNQDPELSNRIEYQNTSTSSLVKDPQEKNNYDVVTSMEVIEHVENKS
jgi:polyprenyldihydroxybenzoate methyltransferase / 3-demethylubiquinol 3-O-methyltransferase